jgi:hypothetical protein
MQLTEILHVLTANIHGIADDDTLTPVTLEGMGVAAERLRLAFEKEKSNIISEITEAMDNLAKSKPYTNDFVNSLLVNAMRCLSGDQMYDLTRALFDRIRETQRMRIVVDWMNNDDIERAKEFLSAIGKDPVKIAEDGEAKIRELLKQAKANMEAGEKR